MLYSESDAASLHVSWSGTNTDYLLSYIGAAVPAASGLSVPYLQWTHWPWCSLQWISLCWCILVTVNTNGGLKSEKKKNSLVYCWWKLPRPTVLSARWFIIESLRYTEYKLLHSLKHKVSLLFNSLKTPRSKLSFYGKDTDCVWLVNIWMNEMSSKHNTANHTKKQMKSYFDSSLCR